jgi:hypothetical protein
MLFKHSVVSQLFVVAVEAAKCNQGNAIIQLMSSIFLRSPKPVKPFYLQSSNQILCLYNDVIK